MKRITEHAFVRYDGMSYPEKIGVQYYPISQPCQPEHQRRTIVVYGPCSKK